MKPVIFTDLDGTLLSPADNSFAGAAPALERIRAAQIPLVLCTSKTRAEIERIRLQLANSDPFVSENGGGIFIPRGYFRPYAGSGPDGYELITLGRPYEEVRAALEEARGKIKAELIGFGDMSREDISRLTGLGIDEAGLAKKRDFDEPFIFRGDSAAEKELERLAGERGFRCTKGRLFHMAGRHDKGAAAGILKRQFKALYGSIAVICLGDGPNDRELLSQADYPVLVKKEDGSYEDIGLQGVIKADGIGPDGWNRAVTGILDTIEAAQTGYRC